MPAAQAYQEESVFNMALAYLKRIDHLLTLCQRAAFTGNIDEWLTYLRGVYREASVRLTDDEKKELLGDSKELIDMKKLTDDFIEEKEGNFTNIYYLTNNHALKMQHKRVIMFLLDCLEVKIRRKLQERGMLLPSKQDPTKAVLNM